MFYDEPSSYHDVALVCLNGHMINDSSRTSPEFNKKFCDRCGEPTTNECPGCKSPIKGDYKSANFVVIGTGTPPPPAYCEACGKPFPWTERRLAAARETIDELSELSKEDQERLKGTLDDLVKESPKTEPAKLRFKNIIRKTGKESYEVVKGVLTDLVSETVRKSLFGS